MNANEQLKLLAGKVQAREARVADLCKVVRNMAEPTPDLDWQRQLEIRELARQIKAGNRQALKDWNRREAKRLRGFR